MAEKKEQQENLASALQIEAPEERQKAIAEIAWNALETDPQLAEDALAKLTADSEDRLQLIEHFAMTKASEDPEAAMAWARSLESDLEISTALGQIALVIADTDPHRAAQLLSDSGMEGRQFDVAVVQVLERWAEQDPIQATDWVMSFPPGETRQAGLTATFSTWADRDTSNALAWMATVEGEPKSLSALLGNIAFVGVGAIWVPLLLEHARKAGLIVGAALAFLGWAILAAQLGADDIGLLSFAAALLASLVVLTAVWQMPSPVGRVGRMVAFVGEASLAIYVMHGIVIAIVRVLLQTAGLLDEAVLIFAGTVLGLALPAALYWIALAVSARSGWPLTRLAGLGTATQSHYIPTRQPGRLAAVPAQS
ncbi:MAG: hypothetical protein MUF13_07525 [Akkermansiaceae bacterium]|nr:hypothetical protein [Akkermansiaceae bacterium]